MKQTKLRTLILAAMFAALTCVATMIIHIPSPIGGYFNLGDCMVLLSAFVLGPVWGTAAGGIGSALADVICGYFVYAPGTLVIKALMGLLAALGYRFGHKFSLLRKRNMVRLKKSLSECYRDMRKHRKIRPKLAQGLLSRLGQMKHCNHVHFFEKYVETGLQRKLKLVVREHTRKEQARWNMCTEPLKSTA